MKQFLKISILFVFAGTLLGIFSLNIVSIIFERFRRLRSIHRKLLTYRMIVLIWMFAIILSIPTVLMITYTHVTVPEHSYNDTSEEKGSCKSVSATVAWNSVRMGEIQILYHKQNHVKSFMFSIF